MMKKKLPPNWPRPDQLKGERMHQVWERFFSERQQAEKGSVSSGFDHTLDHRLSAALVKHQAALLDYPNVIGVAEGIRTKRGKPTGDRCLVVYVTRKLPKSKLRASELLPREIDGIPVDVVEVGQIEPLPL
jgi:hypothetical protein